MAHQRIDFTPAAKELIDQIKVDHGDVMFHQSGGCCDGSAPMCFPKGEFRVGSSDVMLGSIEDSEFYMSADQFEYWQHTHLTIDVTEGRGASFSLEIPYGKRFVVRSRLFTDTERADLEPVHRAVEEG
ncbi:MAG: DUF779 domain-containing protein [Flavobacteriales bacterium]